MARNRHDDEEEKRREAPPSRRNGFYVEEEDRAGRPRNTKRPVKVTYEDDGYDEAPPPKRVNHHHYYEDDLPPKRVKRKDKSFSFFGFIFKWLFILGAWATVGVIGIVIYYAALMPPLQDLKVPKRPPNIQILYNDGSRMADRGEMGAPAVPLKELPLHMAQALIAIEDRRFYSHFGIDLIGFGRAMVSNITRTRGPIQGGSTLTQQLAKNLFLTQERTFSRKVQEGILAFWLEYKYSKDEILELYLNRVYFGAGAYGIEAAANRFYGKPAKQLTLKQAAIIAGAVQAPTRLNPTRHPEAAEKRSKLVLNAMLAQGKINESAFQLASKDPAKVNKIAGNAANNYVADWIIDLLDDYIGKFENDITVQTTLNPTLQASAERIVQDELNKQGDKLNVEQAAVVVMGLNGEVFAMIGGKNYAESQFNRAVTAKRQPGSSFKPFVFQTAIEAGLTADTLREDSPVTIGKWSPENYTRDFKGSMTLANAMAQSTNTIAVKLGQEFTPRNIVKTAQFMGIDSKLEANASLPLGTSEVTLLELTKAYVPYANGGMNVTPFIIRMIFTTENRKALYTRANFTQNRIIEPNHLAQMHAMMHEVVKSGSGRRVVLNGWTVAGKTGTTQDFRDAWFMGFTGRYVTGVWVGNDDAEPMKRVTGGGFPIDIWNRVMVEAHKGQRPVDLPSNWRQVNIEPPVVSAPPRLTPEQSGDLDRALRQNEPPSMRQHTPAQRDEGLGGLLGRIFGR